MHVLFFHLSVYQNDSKLVALQIGRLSEVDSDFAAFVQHAGVPSIDLYYGKGILFAFVLGERWHLLENRE